MKWNHLPNDGGLYNQHPEFIRKIQIIFSELDKQERAERRKQEAASRNKRGSSRVAGRR